MPKFQTTLIYFGMYPKALELILKLSMTHRPEFKHLNSQHRDHLIWMTNKFIAAKFHDSVRRQFIEVFSMISVFLDFSKCKAGKLKKQ